MCDDRQLLERTLNVLQACQLPPLQFDFDSQPIGKQDFNDFHVVLDDQLHLLLDILYQNGNLLKDQDYDNQGVKLKSEFVIVACEQIEEPNEFFQTDQSILVSSLSSLLTDNFADFHNHVIRDVIDYYKKQLHNDVWKRNFGSVFGFSKFCELLSTQRKSFFDSDFIMFTLSVGSKLISLVDPLFRTIGLKLYRTIVSNCDQKKLRDLNIHQVIHGESFSLIKKSSGLAFNDHLFDVMYETSRLDDGDVRNSKWCKFDDIMTELLEKAGLESDGQLFLLLLGKLVRFCAMSYDRVESFDDIETVKAVSRETNYRTMRWIKKLSQFIIRESSRILNSREDGLKILNYFHCIYVLSFANVDAEMLGENFVHFLQKLVIMQMQILNHYQDDDKFKAEILKLLSTIRDHNIKNEELIVQLDKIILKIQ